MTLELQPPAHNAPRRAPVPEQDPFFHPSSPVAAGIAFLIGGLTGAYLIRSGPAGAGVTIGGRVVLLVVILAFGTVFAGIGLLLTFARATRPTGSLVLAGAGALVLGMIVGFLAGMAP